MIVKFKSLKLYNFMSFESADVELSNKGFVQVVGINNSKSDNSKSNGSGKSAIFEGINWCLTGETLRGSKDVVRNGCEDGTFVALCFDVDNCQYKVTRTKNHKKYKTNLFIEKNGEDISGKGIRDTEVILNNVLPELSAQLINSIIILGQGLPMRFTNNTPSGRKEVLEKLSKSDFMIQDLKDRILERKNELYVKKTSILEKLTEIEANRKVETRQLNLAQSELAELDEDAKKQKSSEKEQYKNRLQEIDALTFDLLHKYGKSVQDEYEDVQKEKMAVYSEGLNGLDKLRENHRLELDPLNTEYSKLSAEITILEREINRLDSISDVCPTCGQKLPDVHKIDTTDKKEELSKNKEELNEKKLKIESLRNDQTNQFKLEKSKLEERINKYDDLLSDLYCDKEELSNLILEESQLNNKIDNIDNWLESYASTSNTLLKNINELTKSLESLDNQKNELSAILEDVENRLTIQSKFDTIIKRDFRGILLQNCIKYINDKAKEYCQKVFKTNLIEFALDGNNVSISYNGKEYESMSGGEKQKIDLIIQFALRDMLCKYLNFSCNLLVLDELTDNVDSDGCKLIMDFISEVASDVDSVFIISHHTDLELPSDNELTIIKNEQGISSVLLQA